MFNLVGRLAQRWRATGRGGARALIPFSDRDIEQHFLQFGYVVAYPSLAFTTEEVEDYLEAQSSVWHRPGRVARFEQRGLLIVQDAQPHARQPTRDVIVVSLGDARVVVGVINREGRRRFARTM